MATYIVDAPLVNVVRSLNPDQIDRVFKGESFELDDKEQAERYIELGAIHEEGAEPTDTSVDTASFDPTGAGMTSPDNEGHAEDGSASDAENESTTEPLPPAPTDFSKLSYPELQAAAKERGLSAGGTTEELVSRLEEHEKSNS